MAIFINENGIKRQLTSEEETAFDAQAEKAKTDKANKKIAEENTANKKASGKQKLKDLGLDDDEIKALTGA
jgi:prophage tail gpP-like protein